MIIRNYKPEDNKTIHEICRATSNGKYSTKDKYFQICSMLFLDYFLDFEPENCFVIDEDGTVKGYIVCCTNTALFKEKMLSVYAKKIKKLSFFHYLFTKISVSQSDKLNKLFGCQFHINIAPDSQGKHYGPKLLDTLALHLNKLGHKYMYLITSSKKTRGYFFYRHYGFDIIKNLMFGCKALAFEVDRIKEVR